jgi:hypothetical protein
LRFGADGKGLGLAEYAIAAKYPTGIFRLSWPARAEQEVYGPFHITDVWIASDGAGYAAGTLYVTRIGDIVPSKVIVLRSVDFKDWDRMDVDYRAVANTVMLAGADGTNLWMATNNGMILKLIP